MLLHTYITQTSNDMAGTASLWLMSDGRDDGDATRRFGSVSLQQQTLVHVSSLRMYIQCIELKQRELIVALRLTDLVL